MRAQNGPFAEQRLSGLWKSYDPLSFQKCDLLAERFLLASQGQYRVFFAPLGGFPESGSCIVFVGLTPGLAQLQLSAKLYRETEAAERDDAVVFGRMLRSEVAFGGQMRANLCKMLDEIGLHRIFDVDSSLLLFNKNDEAGIAATSALVYPVFKGPENRNFGGTVDLPKTRLFREMIDVLLAPRLIAAPNALIVPLGMSASTGVCHLIDQGLIDRGRVLIGFPHPSGNNGHRKAQFAERREDLERQLRQWSVDEGGAKCPSA